MEYPPLKVQVSDTGKYMTDANSSLTPQRIELNEAFDALTAQLGELVDHLYRLCGAAVVYEPGKTEPTTGLDALRAACWMYRRVYYTDDQAPQDTAHLTGVLMVDQEGVARANAVNAAKERFRRARQQLRNASRSEATEAMGQLLERDPALADTLRRTRRARLNVRQTERAVPIAPEGVTRVGFTWQTQPGIYRLTAAEVLDLLRRHEGDPTADADRSRVAALPADTPLARIRKQPPQRRANLSLLGRRRRMMTTPIPLLVPADDPGQCVDISIDAIDPPDPSNGPRRADRRIDPQPFLYSLPIHQYLQLAAEKSGGHSDDADSRPSLLADAELLERLQSELGLSVEQAQQALELIEAYQAP